MAAATRTIRAPRGTALTCKGWPQEAALRMLMTNLDPEVAERPEDLVVYGGSGKAARNWPSYDAIVRALTSLEHSGLAAAPEPLANVAVTATPTLTGFNQSLTVVALVGASGTGATEAAGAATGPSSVSLTTTRAGSLVYGVGNDSVMRPTRLPR